MICSLTFLSLLLPHPLILLRLVVALVPVLVVVPVAPLQQPCVVFTCRRGSLACYPADIEHF